MRSGAPIMVAEGRAHTTAGEQFRTLAVEMTQQIRQRTSDGFVLDVTSPEPSVGKTLSSLNLVLTMAPPGTLKRLLLVECDLWNPTLQEYLDVDPSTPGLYQYLNGEISLADAKVPLWASMVDVIFAGQRGEVDNLMGYRRMNDLLEEAREEYEMVVLDSPPFFLASGRTLAGLADGVLVLARADRTRKRGLEDMLSALDADKVLGMSLTFVPEKRLISETAGTYAYYLNPKVQ